jgi:excisionase family DNA binding protein
MNVIKNGIKILNGQDENVFIAVQIASKQLGYSDQYLRKLLRNETIQGIKIGQLWLILCKSLLEYIEVASTTEDLRYGPRVKIKVNEKLTN